MIAPVVRTTTGLGIEVEPEALGGSPEEERVASALVDALSRSERVVEHPAQFEWKGFFQPFLAATGTRSHKAFMSDAQRVSIRAVADQLKFTPARNLGNREGFEPIPDDTVIVSANDQKGAAITLLHMLAETPRLKDG